MTTIFKYAMIIMLIVLAIGFANMYPIIKYTALIAFISFIIYKIKKYKSKPSKEEMARFEAEYDAKYEAKLKENALPVITKEELKKAQETTQKFLNGFDDLTRGLKKTVNVVGRVGPSFYLVAGSGAEYFVSYQKEIDKFYIYDIDEDDNLEGFSYIKTSSGYYSSFEYDQKTNTLFV